MNLTWVLAFLIVLVSGCSHKKSKGGESNVPEHSVEENSSKSISSDRDGEWIRLDTGNAYFLTNQRFFAIDTPHDIATFKSDDGDVSVFTRGDITQKINFVSKDVIKVEQASGSAKMSIFYLLRHGVEHATTKGQLKLTASTVNLLGLASETTEIIFTSAYDSSKSTQVLADVEGNFEASGLETGKYEIKIKTGVSEETSITVDNVRVEAPGDDAGIITINQSPHNFKTLLTPRAYFSFNNETYEAFVTVQNIGNELATGVNYRLSTDDENLVISNGQGILDSIPPGTSKTLKFQYRIADLQKESKRMKINIILKDTEGNEWIDHATIEGWRKKIRLYFKTLKDVEIAGLAIFENRRTYFFSVSGSQIVELPEIVDSNYRFALSAKNLDQETVYEVGVANNANSSLDNFYDTSVFEPNNSEEKATGMEFFKNIISYVHIGDIDFFSFDLPKTLPPEGLGTESYPYILRNASHIDYINGNFSSLNDTYLKLENDLDLTGRASGFTVSGSNFHFEGGNHTIANFKPRIDRVVSFGFFPHIAGNSSIQNLVLKDFEINRSVGEASGSYSCVGTLIGKANGANIRNISIQNSNVVSDSPYAGGLAGCMDNITVENIRLDTMYVKGPILAGVLSGTVGVDEIGSQFNTIKKIRVNNSTVYGQTSGGLVGSMYSGEISLSSVNATVHSSEGGGLVGTLGSTDIENCSTAGAVFGNNVGGMIGTAGLVNIQRSYSTATVSGTRSGGLVGYSYSPSSVLVTDSYWDATSSGQTTSLGTVQTGLTTTQMQTMATYVGWDFISTWLPPQSGQPPSLIWLDQ